MEFIKNARFEILDNVQVIHDEENSHYNDLLDIQYVEFISWKNYSILSLKYFDLLIIFDTLQMQIYLLI